VDVSKRPALVIHRRGTTCQKNADLNHTAARECVLLCQHFVRQDGFDDRLSDVCVSTRDLQGAGVAHVV